MAVAFQKKCPVCNKVSVAPNDPLAPFCSKRCADIDLGAWLGERYRVPTNETPRPGSAEDDEG